MSTISKKNYLFPHLPYLENLRQSFAIGLSNEDCLVVGVQHLNLTTGSLVLKLIEIGFLSENIYLLGKNYSSNDLAMSELKSLGCFVDSIPSRIPVGSFTDNNQKKIFDLWSKVNERLRTKKFKSIILLDDGGRLIESVPDHIKSSLQIVSIEQTTKGIKLPNVINSTFPVISVASSRLKRGYESKIIANGIAFAISRIDISKKRLGIIGLGAIGQSLANKFCKTHNIYTYDSQRITSSNSETVDEVIKNSDIVFGCTGTNLEISLSSFTKEVTTLVSCSSEDIEFSKILKTLQVTAEIDNYYSSPDLLFEHKNAKILLLNSGYPVNFRNDCELEPIHEIQITRSLILAAIFQAVEHNRFNNLNPGLNDLCEKKQQYIESLITDVEFMEASI